MPRLDGLPRLPSCDYDRRLMQTRLEPAARGALRAAALLCAAGALFGCGERRETRALPAAPTQLKIAHDGAPNAALTPLYAGAANGDFTRAGLAVSVPTAPEPALVRLASGAVDVAVASEPDLLLARDQGAALVAIGALVARPIGAIISIAPHPVTKVTQLEGKTVAAPPTPFARAELDTILRQAGVAPAGVPRRDSGADPSRALISSGSFAVLGSWNVDAVRLALGHHRPSVIKVDEAGVPAYNGLVLVVRQSEARGRGPVLRAFLQALGVAVKTTLATPTAAADQFVAANPGSNRRIERAALKATLPVLDPTSTGSPYGFVDPRQWQTFGRWMLAQGLLSRSDDTARAVTNEFLPGQGE